MIWLTTEQEAVATWPLREIQLFGMTRLQG